MGISARRTGQGDVASSARDDGVKAGRFLRARSWADETTASIELRDAMHGDHVVVDAFGRILRIATSVATRLGFAPGRLEGRNFTQRMSAGSRSVFQRALGAARIVGVFPEIACSLRPATGSPLTATLGARRTVGEGNRLTMALWVRISVRRPAAFDEVVR
jgi:hypothetical protein